MNTMLHPPGVVSAIFEPSPLPLNLAPWFTIVHYRSTRRSYLWSGFKPASCLASTNWTVKPKVHSKQILRYSEMSKWIPGLWKIESIVEDLIENNNNFRRKVFQQAKKGGKV